MILRGSGGGPLDHEVLAACGCDLVPGCVAELKGWMEGCHGREVEGVESIADLCFGRLGDLKF